MSELTAIGFPAFFEALWGHPPFAWQTALAARVIDDTGHPWPQAIALPTAAGKTACLDIAIYALAGRAGRTPTAAPRRIFFVVDRRVIVDAAYERACVIAAALRAPQAPIVAEVAARLRSLAGSESGITDAVPLVAHLMRGGIYRSEAWAHSPLQPMVVASTVDQFGSRLLFRGYGRSPKSWPILAGLAGNDALVLLDEAHCAQPFLDTLRGVVTYRGWANQPPLAPFHVAVLSATPPADIEDVFRDTSGQSADPAHPLGKRVLASKPARLVEAIKAKGRAGTGALADVLASTARELVAQTPRAVVVFCNRVATARETADRLRKIHSDRVVLLTGRMRDLDRDDTVTERLRPLGSAHSAARQLDAPLFVVATQTLEVGADLDFDALVSECASLDALRQRFGRLNRMGRQIEAHAAIVVRADQVDQSEDDPVYGAALAGTWQWLCSQADGDGVVDFGVAALGARLPQGDALAALCAPTPHAPVLLPAHVDVLAQTAPVPMPSPEIALYLHGPDRPGGDVQVCFRADVDPAQLDRSLEVLTLCPPATAECATVPIGVMRQWLQGAPVADAGADVEGESVPDVASPPNAVARAVIRWRGPDDSGVLDNAAGVRLGDTLVLPADAPDVGQLCDLAMREQNRPWFDFGDRAQAQTRGRALLRLTPRVLDGWPDGPARARFLDLTRDAEIRLDTDADGFADDLGQALVLATDDAGLPRWLRDLTGFLARTPARSRNIQPHPLGGVIVDTRRRMPSTDAALGFTDEHDAVASGTVRVPLREHLPGVGEFATRFARGCGLPPELVDALACAGRLHDLGKADPRFQALLMNGNPWTVGEPLAKSAAMPQGLAAFKRARERAGYPVGGRHELLSVRMAESTPEALPGDPMLSDLVLHLVGSHHGYCRPFAPVVEDRDPAEVSFALGNHTFAASSRTGLERVDSGVSDRYWRLLRHYGWWGLAWLEAMLRLADHRRSEWEQRRENAHD